MFNVVDGFNSVLVNAPPTANAGTNQTGIAANTLVNLNGSGSTDSDGTIAGYAWTQSGGAVSVTINNANTVTPNFTTPASAQTTILSLVVTDNDGEPSSPSTVSITNLAEVIPDTTAPVITLTGAATINLDVGDTYTELGATALDNIDGDITGSIVITGSVDTGTEGTYYKYYNVSDAAENAATQVARTVVVSAVVIPDTTKPVIVLSPATLTYNLTVGDTFTLPTATLTDNVDSTISISPVSNDVDTATAGAYSVIYSGYEDAAGNVADSVTITVNVFEVTGLLEEIAKTLFSINKKLYTAFKGRGNIETLKFKPIEPIELIEVDADGYFDFDNNEVTKVEFYLGSAMIDTDSAFLSFDGSELNIETGALDIDSGVYSAMVVVYIGSDAKGTVICGPGLTANCVIDFR